MHGIAGARDVIASDIKLFFATLTHVTDAYRDGGGSAPKVSEQNVCVHEEEQGLRFKFAHAATCATFMPTTGHLAVCTQCGPLFVLQPSFGAGRDEALVDAVLSIDAFSVNFSADATYLATTSLHGILRIYTCGAAYRLRAAFWHPTARLFAARFSPDGRSLVLASSEPTACLLSLTEQMLASEQVYTATLDVLQSGITSLVGHTGLVPCAAFSHNGRRVVTASQDQTARLWSVAGEHRGATLRVLRGHTAALTHASFSPDDLWVATSSLDHTVRVYNADSGDQWAILISGSATPFNSVAWSSDGNELVTASDDGSVQICPLSEGTLHPSTTLSQHARDVWNAAFSPDRHVIASASSDSTVWVGSPR
ncbi:MAG: hypothetical protein EOO40_07560 [Deltaproteobacteria bacterium]|nr:MAG: hypothetical protein EOO40_07560 [Deltaproteobacteria bacterium]